VNNRSKFPYLLRLVSVT